LKLIGLHVTIVQLTLWLGNIVSLHKVVEWPQHD